MKYRRSLLKALSIFTASVILSGCAGNPAEPAAPEPDQEPAAVTDEAAPETDGGAADAQEPVSELSGNITVSLWDVDTQMPYMRTMLDDFTSRYPGVSVEIIDIPSADYDTKLNVDLNGGAAADVILIKTASAIPSMAAKGQLADLNEFITRDSLDLASFNGLEQSIQVNGIQTSLPFRTDYYALYYNKDIFDAAGVAYPTNDMTWGEFEELARQVTSGEGQNKFYGAHFHTWQALVENWAVQDGANTIMGPDYTFMKPAYEMVLRMQNEDRTIMDFATLKTANIHYSSVFYNGQVAMLPMGTWFSSQMIDTVNKGESSVNWGIATIPHPEGTAAGNTVGSVTPVAINAASENKEIAWELIKFMTGEEGAAYLASVGQIPARVNPELLNTITALEGMPADSAEALAVTNIVLDRPITDFVNEVDQMLAEQHGLIMLGEVTVDDGLQDIADNSASIQGQ